MNINNFQAPFFMPISYRMGWNPFAAKSNNPLDNVELPADAAIPAAPEQPGGVKEVEKAANQGQSGGAQNIAALSASFSDMGSSMAEFSNIVGDLKRSGQWNEAIKVSFSLFYMLPKLMRIKDYEPTRGDAARKVQGTI